MRLESKGLWHTLTRTPSANADARATLPHGTRNPQVDLNPIPRAIALHARTVRIDDRVRFGS